MNADPTPTTTDAATAPSATTDETAGAPAAETPISLAEDAKAADEEAEDAPKKKKKTWLPLESNPEVGGGSGAGLW